MNEKLEIELSLLRRMCKYFTISCDRYGSCRGDNLELACHHEANLYGTNSGVIFVDEFVGEEEK